MLELAVVLAIRRIAEFYKGENINENKTPLDDLTQSNLDLKIAAGSGPNKPRDKVTDVVDFAALLIFFFSYIIFNIMYIVCYV